MSALRQVVLDTETTGLEVKQGHKLIEIGCVELLDRQLTGNTYHQYINPEREIDEDAVEVHGITSEFLSDKPVFESVAEALVEYISGAELIIHNAAFDIGFLDYELAALKKGYPKLGDICSIVDTLPMARQMYPGQRNSLDALCGRLGVNNTQRTLHGALLDSEILADVYLRLTGGQLDLLGSAKSNEITGDSELVVHHDLSHDNAVLTAVKSDERGEHLKWIELLEKNTGEMSLWRDIGD